MNNKYIIWKPNQTERFPFQERMLQSWSLNKPTYKNINQVKQLAIEGKDLWLRTPANNVENILLDNGVIEKRNARWNLLKPDGSVKDWKNLGKRLATAESLKSIARAYPECPTIWICDNGESSVFKWGKNPWKKNFQDDWTVKGFADAWYELREALWTGFKDNLPDEWKGRVKIVPYDNWRDLYYFILKLGKDHFGEFYQGVYDGCMLSSYPFDAGRLGSAKLAPANFEEILLFGYWKPGKGSRPPTETYLDWCEEQVKKRKPKIVGWFDTYDSQDYSEPLGKRLEKLWKSNPQPDPQPDPDPEPQPDPQPEPKPDLSKILKLAGELEDASDKMLGMSKRMEDMADKLMNALKDYE